MGRASTEIIFIINPNSGKQKHIKILKKIRSAGDYNIFISNSLEEFNDFIKENIDRYKYFVIAGGDGTINEMSQHLFKRKDKILAVIPLGSGNGFAREMGFNTKLKNLFAALERGETLDIDVFELNNKKFINAAGLGFDSCVAHIFANMPGRGLKSYILATLQCMKKFKSFNAEIYIDDKIIRKNYKMITFANTRQFGNNAIIAPNAHPGDGKLDLVLVEPFPSYLYPGFVVKMMTGKIKESKYISILQIDKNIKITTEYTKCHIDGEPVELPQTTELKIYKSSLRVLKMK